MEDVKSAWKQQRESSMDTAELKQAYLKLFVKYAANGVRILRPETVPLFSGRSVKVRQRKYGR